MFHATSRNQAKETVSRICRFVFVIKVIRLERTRRPFPASAVSILKISLVSLCFFLARILIPELLRQTWWTAGRMDVLFAEALFHLIRHLGLDNCYETGSCGSSQLLHSNATNVLHFATEQILFGSVFSCT